MKKQNKIKFDVVARNKDDGFFGEEEVIYFCKTDDKNVAKMVIGESFYEFDVCNLRDRIFELIKFYDIKGDE